MRTEIGTHMVKSPFVADSEMSLKDGLAMMQECGIRHLPVTEDATLIGLVSERDLREAIALPQGAQLRLSDIMKTDIFVVRKDEPLKSIVQTMIDRKIGSTLVVNGEMECVGIFTTIDALEVLADLLDREDEEEELIEFSDYVDFWRFPQNATM